jgi:hypothetical protein
VQFLITGALLGTFDRLTTNFNSDSLYRKYIISYVTSVPKFD